MKFELIKSKDSLEVYDDIPCLPTELTDSIGERFVGEESDSWILLDGFVNRIDNVCPNVLDYGDVDYFDRRKCEIIKIWLEMNDFTNSESRLVYLLEILYDYVSKAVELDTGVIIEL